MYDQNTQAVNRRRSVRAYRNVSMRGRRSETHSQEQIRLIQLVVCLVLFLTIFLGKGVFPQKLSRVRGDILSLISTDFDFKGALTGLGESLAGSGTVLADLGDFCVEVFGAAPQEEDELQPVSFTLPRPAGILTAELQFLSQDADTAVRTAHYADFSRFGLEILPAEEEPEPEPPVEAVSEPEEPAAVPAVGTIVSVSDYDGQELPKNYTMDQLSLGELETVTPVLGPLHSVYGYRDSPLNGKYQFHGGVDIGGEMGDPIAAFAAGTVEYIGEGDSYGLYLQLDHGNGVKSFYAHCSKIVVSKGQTVALGEKIAEVGSTGDSTGPHLHLEMKYNKMHLNPAYYVDFLES